MKKAGKTICIYGASSQNCRKEYVDAAFSLGEEIARRGITLVSGGGRSGLMAAAIDGANSLGGTTIGILPRFMHERGWSHAELSEMVLTETMHERKQEMARLADAVIALPGGSGTLEELLEIITWRQLGLYSGQIVLLDTDGYYQPLIHVLDRAIADGFMKEQHRSIWQVAATPAEAVELALTVPTTDLTPKVN
ncbi:MAG: TIGR00730 family Rossman fold protein [Muribaculaceae bacterium]|nr:TIGR00730 family Rossman fold protein [Muribaculaceae bacterium]